MTFVDHLKGNSPEKLRLEVAFGKHVITGDLAKSIVTGSSPTHIVNIQHLLGEGFGKGWKGPVGIWFRGTNRPSTKFIFHPGIQSPARVFKSFTADNSTDVITCTAHGYLDGDMIIHLAGDLPAPLVANNIYYVRDKTTNTYKITATSGGAAIDLTTNGSGTQYVFKNDAVQGIDPIFDLDTPHSNTAWIRVECPNGSEVGIPDVNTKDNPPNGLTGIYECQLVDIYNSSGTVTSSNQYSTNPADVIAFLCMVARRYPATRIDWAGLDTLRTACSNTVTPDFTTLPQGVGLTGRYYDGTNFTTFKSKRVDPVVQFESSSGAPALDINVDAFSVRWEGKIRPRYTGTYTFYLTHDNGGRLWVNNLSTALIDQWANDGSSTPGTHSATISLTADQFYDVKLEWNEGGSVAEFKFEWESSSQTREVVPQDRLYPKNESEPRFQCNAAFTQPATFDDALRSVLFTCNGGFHDANGKLKFFCITDQTYSFDFTEANIVKNTFNHYPRFSQQDFLSLPNRFIADGRDLDSRYLEAFDPPLVYDLPALQDLVGRVIEETVFVGNTTRWQALTNLAHYAKLKTTPNVAEFEGMPQTLQVLPGDIVRVTHSMPGWTNKQHICVEATDKSIDKDSDNRIFKLYEWA